MAAENTKQPCTSEKGKVSEKEATKEGGDGSSAEVKKEDEGKCGADVKPGKERLNAADSSSESKPPGDRYSPKVRLKNIIKRDITSYWV